jgi:ComF family protein
MPKIQILTDITRFFFPHSCPGCGAELYQHQQMICVRCLKQLPQTGFEKTGDNYTARLFTGRLQLQNATSWLFFGKDGLTQKLIHRIKYRGDMAMGKYLGHMMGTRLLEAGWLSDVDLLIPLPLNRKKLKSRGYNQSTLICEGIQAASGIPLEEVAIMRTVFTETQTHKSRLQRWTNVSHVFDLLETNHLHHRHVLLVDDVITTGATMDACGQVLLQVPGLKLSVLSLAVATSV